MRTNHPMNRTIRYAVIGAGNIAQVAALPAFKHAKENSELVAIISSDETKRKELSKLYNIEHTGAYEELEDIIKAAQVDAVYIALPNHLHREFTERAARAHVHVLCEKPLALTAHDCEAMIHATRAAGVKLMTGYRLHFEEANLSAIDLVKKGDIGEPRIFSSVFSHQVREGDIRTQYEAGGGALYDLGPYCINAARALFQAEPLEVSAFQILGTGDRFRDVDEMTSATLRFPGDRVAQFTVSQGAGAVSSYRIVGSKGDLRVDPAYEYADAREHHLTIAEKTKSKKFAKSDQFAPELVYFSNCIQKDLEPEPSGAEGLADVRIIEAIIRAAQSGHVVALEPFTRAKRPDIKQAMRKPAVREPETIHAPSPTVK
ncbi:MAG: Gfo/Idh/MocA family oxidoreductase [Sandaracinaceae bacterium]|jgi:predicted dehydrogenase|nr:Gfo/Idh/MocA family oxidoreductase [Sandaracinaceae bacterium]